MNLFAASLDQLTLQDLESFLGLALPEEQRLKESERIDYKERVPQDLGDWVAALANASGGLIFVGIRSDKEKQNIPSAWCGIPKSTDLETQIVAKILSTVRPTPEVKIGTVPLENGNVIVVIRVSEGSYPPYEYQQGSNTKISLRTHDARRSANVRDLEALFKRRTEATRISEQDILNHINATGFDCTNSNGIGELNFHRIVVVPRRNAKVRLDTAFEKEFARKISKHFRYERALDVSDRRGGYVQLQSKRNTFPEWHRLWRVYESGAVGFTGTLNGEFSEGKPIGDLAHNLLSICRLAREIFASSDIHGEVYVGHLIRGSNLNLVAKFPEELPLGKYYSTGAITIPPSKEGPDRSFAFTTIDMYELDQPHERIADLLMHNLRELRQIVVEYGGFLSSIRQLIT
jgi:hypothetical protein